MSDNVNSPRKATVISTQWHQFGGRVVGKREGLLGKKIIISLLNVRFFFLKEWLAESHHCFLLRTVSRKKSVSITYLRAQRCTHSINNPPTGVWAYTHTDAMQREKTANLSEARSLLIVKGKQCIQMILTNEQTVGLKPALSSLLLTPVSPAWLIGQKVNTTFLLHNRII